MKIYKLLFLVLIAAVVSGCRSSRAVYYADQPGYEYSYHDPYNKRAHGQDGRYIRKTYPAPAPAVKPAIVQERQYLVAQPEPKPVKFQGEAPEGAWSADPIIEQERKKNESYARQSYGQMQMSCNIPSIEFEFDSLQLHERAYEILDKVAKMMHEDKYLRIIIEGHTDNIGGDEYNDWLSKARAMAAKSYLVSRDIYPDSIKIYGYGKRKPLTMDDTPEGRATNRRVIIKCTGRRWNTVY